MNCRYIINKEKFIEKASLKYGNKFDYSNFEYIDYYTKSIIICPEHGEFLQSSINHMNSKYGCSRCGDKIGRLKRLKYNKEEFIKIANKIHKNKFDYSKFVYINKKTSSIIICPIHGEFLQVPKKHLNGDGCPKCSESKGEKRIRIFLEKQNIKYISEKRFDNCRDKRLLSFDFYLPKYNLCIEYDGKQHFKKIDGINKKIFSEEESKKMLEIIQKHDNIKNEYCNLKNIDLLRISYIGFNNIESILSKKLFNF